MTDKPKRYDMHCYPLEFSQKEDRTNWEIVMEVRFPDNSTQTMVLVNSDSADFLVTWLVNSLDRMPYRVVREVAKHLGLKPVPRNEIPERYRMERNGA